MKNTYNKNLSYKGRNKNNIVLVGFMGVGKSTIGRMLGQKLKLDFIDTDTQVERLTNLSIERIFNYAGQDYFREYETKVLQNTISKNNIVLCTGGGAMESNINQQLIKKIGITYFIDTPFNLIWDRIKNSNRPLIKNKTFKEVEQLYKDRINNYVKSDITISVEANEKYLICQQIADIYFSLQSS